MGPPFWDSKKEARQAPQPEDTRRAPSRQGTAAALSLGTVRHFRASVSGGAPVYFSRAVPVNS